MDINMELLDALKSLQAEIHAVYKMKVRRDYSLMVADSIASKVIAKAEGRLTATSGKEE